jgi:Ser/Thr protein kinase RdoA (MazF antagonist)
MKIDPQILSQAAGLFDLHVSDLRPLGGMEGMALEFQRDGGAFVLKITPKSKDDPAEARQLQEKLEFINYLAENGVRVAKPIQSPAGNWLEIVETESQIYLINALTKAEGRHLELYQPSQVGPVFFKNWGQVTGQMHRLAKTYKTWQKDPGDGSPPSAINDWQGEHKFFAGWCQYDDVRAKWIELGQQIEQLPRSPAGYGLIHNDLHPWNMLVTSQGNITVIDFDVCAYHFFVKDIAIALFFANWNGRPPQGQSKDEYLTAFFQNFMSGYAQKNTLDGFWFKQLPIFLKHHQILLFTVFTDEWKSPNKWQSETLSKWKNQILNDIPVVRLQL